MFGRQTFGNVLQLGHGDGIGGDLVGVRVYGDDVAQVASRTELARGAVARKEYKQAVVFLHAAVGQLVVEGGQYAGAGGFLVAEGHHVVGCEAELLNQRLADGLGITRGVLQLGPLGVIVNANDDGPRVAVAGADSHGSASRHRPRRTLGHAEARAIPGGKLVAIGHQPVQDRGQGFDRAFVDVVEQHNAAAFFLYRA